MPEWKMYSKLFANSSDCGGILDNVVRGTVYDSMFMGRYIPLQYWKEYVSAVAALKNYFNATSSAELILPIRPRESVLPLVTLIVWAKGGQILKTVGGSHPIRIRRVLCTDEPRFSTPPNIKNLLCISSTFGFADEPMSILTMAEEVGADREVGPVTKSLYRKIRQAMLTGVVGREQVNRVLETVTLVAFCALQPNRFILCGQDQAPLINSLWNELRYAKEEDRTTPIGLYVPLMPFSSQENHPMAEDSKEQVVRKLMNVLSTLKARDQQVVWANDLLLLTIGTFVTGDCEVSKGGLQDANEVGWLAREVGDSLYAWLLGILSGGKGGKRNVETAATL